MAKPKIIRAAALLIFIAACVLCPSILGVMVGAVGRLLANQAVIASLPLMLYALVGLSTLPYLWAIPASPMEPDKLQAASLTLAGFCFTSLSLLVSFFKEAIKAREQGPESIILFFCCALACFIASYLALKYRTRNLFPFMSEAFVDNGFWCVMVGLRAFFSRTNGMNKPALVVLLLLIFYVGYLALNFYYHIDYVRRLNRAKRRHL
jgi:hypothetical protein